MQLIAMPLAESQCAFAAKTTGVHHMYSSAFPPKSTKITLKHLIFLPPTLVRDESRAKLCPHRCQQFTATSKPLQLFRGRRLPSCSDVVSQHPCTRSAHALWHHLDQHLYKYTPSSSCTSSLASSCWSHWHDSWSPQSATTDSASSRYKGSKLYH